MDDIKVYDQQGNLQEEYDLALGRLERRTRLVQHPAIEGVEEVWHWETVAEYPNGGKDVAKVIDVEGIEAQGAWEEEVPYLTYIPYTQEELEAIEAEKNKPTAEERIAALEAQLAAYEAAYQEGVREAWA
ncbi:MAG: hypothetical protein IJ461_07315 [Clostridia bacterium]|nr:hypothetical protein [Clostridia bacterium]